MPDILQRLQSAYQRNPAEALQLMPELMDEIGKTVIELPCKVGNILYCLEWSPMGWIIGTHSVAYFTLCAGKYSLEIGFHKYRRYASEIGKTVFLTHTEAEAEIAAIKEKESGS